MDNNPREESEQDILDREYDEGLQEILAVNVNGHPLNLIV